MIIAVDPGDKGGIAKFTSDGSFSLSDMPLYQRGTKKVKRGIVPKYDVDREALAEIFRTYKSVLINCGYVVIERQQAFPRQGVASTAKTMLNYAFMYGAAHGMNIPVITVLPRVWKRHFKLLGCDKKASIKLASELSGQKIKKDGQADAYLIGRWAIATYGDKVSADIVSKCIKSA